MSPCRVGPEGPCVFAQLGAASGEGGGAEGGAGGAVFSLQAELQTPAKTPPFQKGEAPGRRISCFPNVTSPTSLWEELTGGVPG